MTSSEDQRLIAELSLIYDTCVCVSADRSEDELERAASQSLQAVTRWMLAREAARLLAEIDRTPNTRSH